MHIIKFLPYILFIFFKNSLHSNICQNREKICHLVNSITESPVKERSNPSCWKKHLDEYVNINKHQKWQWWENITSYLFRALYNRLLQSKQLCSITVLLVDVWPRPADWRKLTREAFHIKEGGAPEHTYLRQSWWINGSSKEHTFTALANCLGFLKQTWSKAPLKTRSVWIYFHCKTAKTHLYANTM